MGVGPSINDGCRPSRSPRHLAGCVVDAGVDDRLRLKRHLAIGGERAHRVSAHFEEALPVDHNNTHGNVLGVCVQQGRIFNRLEKQGG